MINVLTSLGFSAVVSIIWWGMWMSLNIKPFYFLLPEGSALIW